MSRRPEECCVFATPPPASATNACGVMCVGRGCAGWGKQAHILTSPELNAWSVNSSDSAVLEQQHAQKRVQAVVHP